MSTLLHIESSPRKARSHSIEVAKAFIQAYEESHPGDVVKTLDLWTHPLPEFDGAAIEAKYAIMHGKEHTHVQARAWEAIKAEFEHLASADKVLLSLPMWNFSIPYKLKHFIDVVTQPGLAFVVTKEGAYRGLVTGKPAVVVYARGGEYEAGAPAASYDQQRRYVEQWLGFIGFSDVETILVEPTLRSSEAVAAGKTRALEQARSIARDF